MGYFARATAVISTVIALSGCGTTSPYGQIYHCPYDIPEDELQSILDHAQVIRIRPEFFGNYCRTSPSVCSTERNGLFTIYWNTDVPAWQEDELMGHEACHLYEVRMGVSPEDSQAHIGWD